MKIRSLKLKHKMLKIVLLHCPEIKHRIGLLELVSKISFEGSIN